MTKPRLEFTANNADAADESGVAIWRYTNATGLDFAARHKFASFREARAVHKVIEAAYWAGEAEGYARCEGMRPDPKRAAFESWWRQTHDGGALQMVWPGCYTDRSANVAWEAWQAAKSATP